LTTECPPGPKQTEKRSQRRRKLSRKNTSRALGAETDQKGKDAGGNCDERCPRHGEENGQNRSFAQWKKKKKRHYVNWAGQNNESTWKRKVKKPRLSARIKGTRQQQEIGESFLTRGVRSRYARQQKSHTPLANSLKNTILEVQNQNKQEGDKH